MKQLNPVLSACASVLLLIACTLTTQQASAQDNLKIKDAAGNILLEARTDGIMIRKMTTVERIAVTGLDAGDNGLLVFDSDTKSFWLWHDTQWVEIDGIDLVDDADADPTNELQDWNTLPGIPAGFADGTDHVDDADSDPTNELQTWSSLPGIPAGFADGTDHVDDADNDPTNELQTWSSLPGIPAGFADGTDHVDDADNDPTNELQTWNNLPGIPAGFSDGTDNVDDADSDPLNEKNTVLILNGKQLQLTDAGGTLNANIGWAVGTDKVFNDVDFVGVGTTTPLARLNVKNGTILFDGNTGTTPVSGAGTRMMWIPAKKAFRAGVVNSTQWDDANIGSRSFVGGGTDNVASGFNSIVAGGSLDSAIAFNAFVGGGNNNTSSGNDAFVGGGVNNTASGGTSFVAGGLLNLASGYASFASGRESTASGNHSFAGGHGLLAKSFGETVFGSYNTDYTPVSTTGFNNADRLFVIGNGTNDSTRSNSMTILKSGYVGMGTSNPQAGLHVEGNKGLGQHIMLIENNNNLGSGLKIKIEGSHPLFVNGEGNNPDFFVTHPGSAALTVFDDVAGDITDYLLNHDFNLSEFNFSQIGQPGGIISQLGLDDFMAGGICKGAQTLVEMINDIGWESIGLPDLPLDNIPQDLGDIPNIPAIPSPPNPISINVPNPTLCINFLDIGCWTVPIPAFDLSTNFISNPIATFNTGISNVNTGIGNVNTILEDGYDKVKDGLIALDGLQIPLPQLPIPQNIGPITCPNPNPWDAFNLSFQALNPADYNIVNPLSKQNEFITFVDQYDNKLGAVTGMNMAEHTLDYFKPEKVLKIGGHIFGLFSDDGNIAKNALNLVKEAIEFYKATDKLGVSYSSGHGDYAEWLEREDHTEELGYGDIVGIRGGKISLSLENAEQVMVISKAPIVLGNAPEPGNEMNGNNVAFIGQVPVKVMGPVKTGDYIIANTDMPGYGIAIAEGELTEQQLSLAVGRSWETNETPGFKYVNTIVGMHDAGWAVPVMKLRDQLNLHETAIQQLTARLDNIEQVNSMTSSHKRSR